MVVPKSAWAVSLSTYLRPLSLPWSWCGSVERSLASSTDPSMKNVVSSAYSRSRIPSRWLGIWKPFKNPCEQTPIVLAARTSTGKTKSSTTRGHLFLCGCIQSPSSCLFIGNEQEWEVTHVLTQATHSAGKPLLLVILLPLCFLTLPSADFSFLFSIPQHLLGCASASCQCSCLLETLEVDLFYK